MAFGKRDDPDDRFLIGTDRDRDRDRMLERGLKNEPLREQERPILPGLPESQKPLIFTPGSPLIESQFTGDSLLDLSMKSEPDDLTPDSRVPLIHGVEYEERQVSITASRPDIMTDQDDLAGFAAEPDLGPDEFEMPGPAPLPDMDSEVVLASERSEIRIFGSEPKVPAPRYDRADDALLPSERFTSEQAAKGRVILTHEETRIVETQPQPDIEVPKSRIVRTEERSLIITPDQMSPQEMQRLADPSQLDPRIIRPKDSTPLQPEKPDLASREDMLVGKEKPVHPLVERPEIAEKLAGQFGAPVFAVYHHLATESLKAGDKDTASKLLDKAHERFETERFDDPEIKGAPFMAMLGEAYIKVGETGKAADVFRKGYEETHDAALLVRRAELLAETDRDGAIEVLFEATSKLRRGDDGYFQAKEQLDGLLGTERPVERQQMDIEDFPSAFAALEDDFRRKVPQFYGDTGNAYTAALASVSSVDFRDIYSIDLSKNVLADALYVFMREAREYGQGLDELSDTDIRQRASKIVDSLSISDEKVEEIFANGKGMDLVSGLLRYMQKEYRKGLRRDIMAYHVCSEDPEELAGFATEYLRAEGKEPTQSRIEETGKELGGLLWEKFD